MKLKTFQSYLFDGIFDIVLLGVGLHFRPGHLRHLWGMRPSNEWPDRKAWPGLWYGICCWWRYRSGDRETINLEWTQNLNSFWKLALKETINWINYSLKSIWNPTKMVPFFVMEILGHLNGLPGLFMAAIFMAALRYVTTFIWSIASYWTIFTKHLFQKCIKTTYIIHIDKFAKNN